MSDIKPNVNFMLQYYLPHYKDKKMQDKRDYYSSHKVNDYIKYVDTGIKDLKNIDFVEYTNNRTKSSGIFNKNGKMNKKEISEVREHLRETQSVIWSGVISFEEKFGLKWCNNHAQAEHILKSELPKFFKRSGLNPDNIEWFAGLHENTDNRHIHLVFFEKQPIRIKKNGKAFSMGKLSINAMKEFKLHIEECATDFRAREIKIRTSVIKSVKEELNGVSSFKLKNKLLKLADKLPPTGHTYYECQEIKNLQPFVDEIANYIFNKNINIKSYKEDFDDIVKEKDEFALNYCKRNGYKNPTQSIGDKMMKDLYRRVGNPIIEKAKEIKKEEIKRQKYNAKYKSGKIIQKKKLQSLLNQCLYLNSLVEYESIKAFQDYQRRLYEVRIKALIEQGIIIEDDGFKM
ncbi:MAG TPA: hypothetical protein IAC38_04450 [Candidatus Caccovivens faecavium]|nr:hypothetical protein [Candidatus Caccovivens faecavium]